MLRGHRSARGGWVLKSALFLVAVMLGFAAGEGSSAAEGETGVLALSESAPPETCSQGCDRKASECVDACESKYQEAKPRVECKVGCIGEREKCDKDCK